MMQAVRPSSSGNSRCFPSARTYTIGIDNRTLVFFVFLLRDTRKRIMQRIIDSAGTCAVCPPRIRDKALLISCPHDLAVRLCPCKSLDTFMHPASRKLSLEDRLGPEAVMIMPAWSARRGRSHVDERSVPILAMCGWVEEAMSCQKPGGSVSFQDNVAFMT